MNKRPLLARLTLFLPLLAFFAVGLAATPASAAAPLVTPTRELAIIVQGQTAMAKPDEHSKRLAWVERLRPITEGRTVLPVIGHRTGKNDVRWLEVRLPGRPNNRTGWIRKAKTKRSFTVWHLLIDLSDRRVIVYRRGKAVQSFSSVIGTVATPTPRGRFFVEESVHLSSGRVGGPFALALSARSYVLQEFAGGPGQIAIHGVWNVGGRMGSAVSHGCVRLDTASISWIGQRIGPGVPVTIRS